MADMAAREEQRAKRVAVVGGGLVRLFKNVEFYHNKYDNSHSLLILHIAKEYFLRNTERSAWDAICICMEPVMYCLLTFIDVA